MHAELLEDRYSLHPGWKKIIMQTIASHNMDPEQLIERFEVFPNSYGEYDIRNLRALHQYAIATSHNELFSADTANYITPFSFGCYSLMLWSAPNIYQLIHDAVSYFIFIAPQIRFKVMENDDTIEIWIINNNSNESSKVTTIGIVIIISTLLTIIKKATGRSLPSSAYYTSSSECSPEMVSALERRFNTKIIGSSSHRRLVFKREDLNTPLIHSCNEVYQANLAMVKKRAAQLSKSDVIMQLNAIFEEMDTLQHITINHVASKLYISPRTLNRKLAKVGTTFKATLNNYRLEVALKLLKESNIAVTTIAYQLGFSEISSFSRAFKRWTGYSPTEIDRYK